MSLRVPHISDQLVYYQALHRVSRCVVVYQFSTPSCQPVDAALVDCKPSPNMTISVSRPLFSAVLLLLLPSAFLCFCRHSKVLNVWLEVAGIPTVPLLLFCSARGHPLLSATMLSAFLACPPSIFCILLPLPSYKWKSIFNHYLSSFSGPNYGLVLKVRHPNDVINVQETPSGFYLKRQLN